MFWKPSPYTFKTTLDAKGMISEVSLANFDLVNFGHDFGTEHCFSQSEVAKSS